VRVEQWVSQPTITSIAIVSNWVYLRLSLTVQSSLPSKLLRRLEKESELVLDAIARLRTEQHFDKTVLSATACSCDISTLDN